MRRGRLCYTSVITPARTPARMHTYTQSEKGATSSMQGKVLDRFFSVSEGQQYLKEREPLGAGYTRRLYGGHLTVPTLPAKDGYNGPEGYRRNTPDLRYKRSPFDYEGLQEFSLIVQLCQLSCPLVCNTQIHSMTPNQSIGCRERSLPRQQFD